MQAFVDRFRAKASKARQAQSRIKALAKHEADRGARRRATCAPIQLSRARQALSPPIIASTAAVGYEPASRCSSASTLRIDDDDRIALLGANGNGKSTFAKLLAGRLQADAGTDDARAAS